MIGIDFGTTNSCAAYDDALGNVVVVSAQPHNTPPYDGIVASTVLDPLSPDPLIGIAAQVAYQSVAGRDRPYLNGFKPHLDHQRLKERRWVPVGTQSVYDPMAQAELVEVVHDWMNVGGGTYSRAEIVAAVAALVRALVDLGRSEGADDSVLLVGLPVSFSSRARKRLIAALHAAGAASDFATLLRRVRFIDEPVAAAAAATHEGYGLADRERVLVFDHGGGTLDLSIIEFHQRPDFPFPVPVRELAANGRDDVAGRSIDRDLGLELRQDPDLDRILDAVSEWDAASFVETLKIRLSTRDATELVTQEGALGCDRATLRRAIGPILARIEQLIERTLVHAHLLPGEIDRVLMTGGSSLMPDVQNTMSALFPHLDDLHLRRYDPHDDDDVQSAITEVAQGLVRFGMDDTLGRVAHWDVELSTSEHPEFQVIVPQGTPFDRDADGRPSLVRTVSVDDANRDGMSFGLYERQLDRTFTFGLAEVPPQPDPVVLEVTLRPEALFPTLRLLSSSDGSVLRREISPTGWPSDKIVAADLGSLGEDQLIEFFENDVEYIPDCRFARFEHAPLCRRLKVEDYVEWTAASRGGIVRRRGEIQRILRRSDHESVTEMDDWDLRLFRFHVRSPDFVMYPLQVGHGYIRLAPKPL